MTSINPQHTAAGLIHPRVNPWCSVLRPHKTRIIEERTQQAEEGKSRVTEARIQIQKEIETRAQVTRLPETMTALLHQVWSKIPLLAYLQRRA